MQIFDKATSRSACITDYTVNYLLFANINIITSLTHSHYHKVKQQRSSHVFFFGDEMLCTLFIFNKHRSITCYFYHPLFSCYTFDVILKYVWLYFLIHSSSCFAIVTGYYLSNMMWRCIVISLRTYTPHQLMMICSIDNLYFSWKLLFIIQVHLLFLNDLVIL